MESRRNGTRQIHSNRVLTRRKSQLLDTLILRKVLNKDVISERSQQTVLSDHFHLRRINNCESTVW